MCQQGRNVPLGSVQRQLGKPCFRAPVPEPPCPVPTASWDRAPSYGICGSLRLDAWVPHTMGCTGWVTLETLPTPAVRYSSSVGQSKTLLPGQSCAGRSGPQHAAVSTPAAPMAGLHGPAPGTLGDEAHRHRLLASMITDAPGAECAQNGGAGLLSTACPEASQEGPDRPPGQRKGEILDALSLLFQKDRALVSAEWV